MGKPPEILCQVICDGQGPSIGFVPLHINFGKIPVLETVTQQVEMLNDTPIPAALALSIVRTKKRIVKLPK